MAENEIPKEGVVTPTITSDGKSMNKSYEWLSIDIIKEINRIPYAQIVLADGSAPEQTFPISDDTFFEPGKNIEIKLRYEDAPNEETSVFSGFVVKHSVELGSNGTILIVEMKDTAIKMTQGRNYNVFIDKTDIDVIGELARKSAFKLASPTPVTKPAHKKLVQYSCTDWDFILSRAEANGLVVVVDDKNSLRVSKLEVKGNAKYTFTFGLTETTNFEMLADASHQFAKIQSVDWDTKTQKLTAPTNADAFSLKQGNLDGSKIAKSLGAELQTLSGRALLTPDSLKAWADGSMAKDRMSLLRGRVSVPGSGKIKCLDEIEFAGVGKRFNGTTLISGVHHRLDINGWQTDIQFGLSAEAFTAQKDVADLPAAGLLPPVSGLQIGIVTALQDPDKEMRVSVQLPSLGEKSQPLWARMGFIYAGKNYGHIFMPEIGDEVIVGFFNDDPSQPVILGSMYSGKNTPPTLSPETDDKNFSKAIITKSGIAINLLDGDKPKVTIATPGKNTIVIDDDQQSILLKDQHGNTITMNKDGVEIKSAKDFKINASGNVEIKGAKVDVK